MTSADLSIKHMVLAQNNGYDLCSGLDVGGRPRYLMEGAC